MKPSEILRSAKNIITTEETWTTMFSARNSQGEPCVPWDASAACWCAYGAARRVAHSQRVDLTNWVSVLAYLEEASLQFYGENLSKVNDDFGFDAVHKVYGHAIESAEATEEYEVQ